MSDEIHERIDVGGIAIAVRRQDGRAPGIMWLGGFRSDMTGTKAETLASFAARPRLGLSAARLFRARRLGRRIPRRHDLALAWRKPCRVPSLRGGPRDTGRLVDGRLDRTEDGGGVAQGGRGRPHCRARADRAGAGFHHRADAAAAHQEAEEGAGRDKAISRSRRPIPPSRMSTRRRCSTMARRTAC